MFEIEIVYLLIFVLILLLVVFIYLYFNLKSNIRNNKVSKYSSIKEVDITNINNSFDSIKENNQSSNKEFFTGKMAQEIFYLNPAIMGIVNIKDEVFVDVNEQFLKVLEFNKSEVIGKSALELGLHTDIDQRTLMFEKLNREGVIKDFELKVKTKSGKLKILVFNGSIINIRNKSYFIAIVTDITDFVNTEESLKENQKNLMQLFDFSPLALCITDFNKHKIIKCNLSAIKLLELTNEEIENFGFCKFLSESGYSDFIEQINKNGKIYDFETQIINAKGEKKWVLISADSINYYGERVWLIGIIDITVRKEIEGHLQFSELKFLTAFNNMPAIMVIVDIEKDEIIDVNNSFENTFSFSKEDVIGKKSEVFLSLFPKNDMIMIGKLLRTNNTVRNYQTTYCDKDGKTRFFHFSVVLFDINNKKFSLNIITDISEFIDTDNALKQSEENYRMIVENTTDGIYILKNSKFIFFNKRMQQALGYSYDELRNIDALSLIHPEDKENVIDLIRKKKKKKNSPITYESRIITKSGEIRNCIFTTKDIKYSNEDAVLGIVHDITELRNAENELIQFNRYLEEKVEEEFKKREKQENILVQKSKLEFLGEMAAGMAHEINQPLTGISMAMENLLNKFDKKDASYNYFETKVGSVFDYIDRIKKIIEHVRIFSRDQQSTINEVFSINEVIKNALSLIEKPYQALGIRIITNIENDELFIKGNKFRLEQVILNLLSNSKDALIEKTKKQKNFNDKKIEIIISKDKNWIWLEIKDNGIGIETSQIDNIFNPFYTSKDADKGTGLGLSIVYGIIKEFNGDIFTESKPDYYTIMKIVLPREYK